MDQTGGGDMAGGEIFKTNFVKVLGDTPVIRMWDFLINSRGLFDFSLTDISEATGISWNTLKEIFPLFEKEAIVKKTRQVGRATMYILNENHPKARFMIGMHKAISMVFVHGGHFKLEVTVKKGKKKESIYIDMTQASLKPLTH